MEKIVKIFNFLRSININVLILVNKKDESLKIIEKIIEKNKIKNCFFFKNLSNNYEVSEQIFVANHSRGYLGTHGGIHIFFYLLKKKTLIFDTFFHSKVKYSRNINFLYKTLLLKNKKLVLNEIIYKKIKKNIKNFFIYENSADEIINKFNKFFKISKKNITDYT